MTKLQRLQVEASEKRQALNALLALDELTDDQRAELGTLTTRMQQIEVETRAAIVAEGDAEVRDLTTAPDAEMRERLELRGRANLTEYIRAALSGRMVSGAEAELQAAAKIQHGGIPLELWDTARPVEHRADSPTGAVSTPGVNLDRIRPFVFANSIAPRLGIEMPRVESGTYVSATITTALTAGAKAKSAETGQHDGCIHADERDPRSG